MHRMEYSGGIAYDLAVSSSVLQGSQTQWILMSHLGGWSLLGVSVPDSAWQPVHSALIC